MGLDMHLEAEKYLPGMWRHMAEDETGKPTAERLKALTVLEGVGLRPDDVLAGGITVTVQAAYWRKANQIHRSMGYSHGPWTAETLRACICGHLRGDHFRHDGQCLFSTETETWACDCVEFTPR